MRTAVVILAALFCLCVVLPVIAEEEKEQKEVTLTGTVRVVKVDDVEKTQLVVPAEADNEEPACYTIVADEQADALKAALKDAPDAVVVVKGEVDEDKNLTVKSFEMKKEEVGEWWLLLRQPEPDEKCEAAPLRRGRFFRGLKGRLEPRGEWRRAAFWERRTGAWGRSLGFRSRI